MDSVLVFPTFDFGDGKPRELRPTIGTMNRIKPLLPEGGKLDLSGDEGLRLLPQIVVALLKSSDRKEISIETVEDLATDRLTELSEKIGAAFTLANPDPAKNEKASPATQSSTGLNSGPSLVTTSE